jgi:hypothetical protein
MYLTQGLHRALQRHPDKTALVHVGEVDGRSAVRHQTFRDLLDAVARQAGAGCAGRRPGRSRGHAGAQRRSAGARHPGLLVAGCGGLPAQHPLEPRRTGRCAGRLRTGAAADRRRAGRAPAGQRRGSAGPGGPGHCGSRPRAPRRPPCRGRRPGRAALHRRHHRPRQGRDAHARQLLDCLHGPRRGAEQRAGIRVAAGGAVVPCGGAEPADRPEPGGRHLPDDGAVPAAGRARGHRSAAASPTRSWCPPCCRRCWTNRASAPSGCRA